MKIGFRDTRHGVELCVGSLDEPSPNDWMLRARLRYVYFGLFVATFISLPVVGAMIVNYVVRGWLGTSLFALAFAGYLKSMDWMVSPPCKATRWDEAYWAAYKQVPEWKMKVAWTLYGVGGDAALSAIECEEAHLAGDCPLCGAE